MRLSSNLRGIGFALLQGFAVATTLIVGKYATRELPPFEVAFVRNLFMTLAAVPWMMRTGVRDVWPARPVLQGFRGLISAAGMLLIFWALPILPLADLTAIEMTAPLWSVAMAILFVGEGARLYRWAGLFVGFLGTLVILRPGFAEISPGALAVLGASLAFAGNRVIAKVLVRTDTLVSIVVFRTLVMTVAMLPFAFGTWIWPTPLQWGLLVVLGALGLAAQFFITRAIQLADMGAIEPVGFLRLVWAAVFGYLLFSEIPNPFTLLGGALVIGSILFIANRERREGSGGVTPPSSL